MLRVAVPRKQTPRWLPPSNCALTSTPSCGPRSPGAPHGPPTSTPCAAPLQDITHAKLTGDFAWTWTATALERPLWPLAQSAVDLLRAGPLDRLAECERCRWLFLDLSRNR